MTRRAGGSLSIKGNFFRLPFTAFARFIPALCPGPQHLLGCHVHLAPVWNSVVFCKSERHRSVSLKAVGDISVHEHSELQSSTPLGFFFSLTHVDGQSFNNSQDIKDWVLLNIMIFIFAGTNLAGCPFC